MKENSSIFCQNKNQPTERFLEVCLLLLLHEKDDYGYGLSQELPFFGFSDNELNVSTMYRILRRIEKIDLVESTWEESGLGPRRRVYRITEKGKEELSKWIVVLKNRKLNIQKLIDRFERPDHYNHLEE